MAKMNIPASPTLYYTHYDKLKGADFTSDPTQVDRRRSPDVLNMIKENGNIVKRRGWRLDYMVDGKIKKIFKCNENIFTITDKALYQNGIQIYRGNIERCCASKLNDRVAIFLDGKFYYVFNLFDDITGEAYTRIEDMLRDDGTYNPESYGAEPYIPDVVISRNPDGTGGTFLESVNLLTANRRISFLSDGKAIVYCLFPSADMGNSDYARICVENIKVEKMKPDGTFTELKKDVDYFCEQETTAQGYDAFGNIRKFQIALPMIRFSTVPEKSYITGQDNVRVTFQPFDFTLGAVRYGQINRTLQKLLKSEISISYGKNADDRMFCVVDGNRIYYSDVNKLNYWPDDNYIIVGNGGEITGITRINEYLAVIKEKNDFDNTVFLVKGTEYDGKTVFTVESSLGNVGALGDTLTTLNDEPLFLSGSGICAISNSYVNTEKMIRNRSRFLDGKLLKEPDLKKAVATSWKGYYVLCVNGHVYLLDGKQTATDKVEYNNFVYEGYYWDSPDALCVADIDGILYLGTDNGKVYRYSDDLTGEIAYVDDPLREFGGVLGNGSAIKAHWATPLDDDAKPQYFKNLNKKGTALTLLPYNKSSVSVYYSKDGNVKSFIGKTLVDIFNWNVIDFSRFSFNSNEAVQDAYANKKIKKYKRLQFILENNEPGEPFGLIGFVKTYTVGNFAK